MINATALSPEDLHTCKESRDSDTPTPLEFAFELLAIHPADQVTLVEAVADDDGKLLFSLGWEAGVEYTLEESTLPVDYHKPNTSKAWLAGFVAGQYAGAEGYTSPTCIFSGHGDH